MSLTNDLDQIVSQYRSKLTKITDQWAQLAHVGHCDMTASKTAHDIMTHLENAVAALMDQKVKVEQSRQSLMNLRAVLDISRQTVEAKSQHLGQEEMQKEELQNLRFKEFQKIHKCQAETAVLDTEIIPVKGKLNCLMTTLDEKNEKMRKLEHFYEILSDHCALDLATLKEQTEEARIGRAKWDQMESDIGDEVNNFPLNKDELTALEEEVQSLKEAINNHKNWYDEELKTKLFLSTRSKEIKHRIGYYRNALRRFERTGRSDDREDESEEKHSCRRSEKVLVDSSPGVKAKEVERYLSHAFGVRVLADYTMLKRLKDEIGVQGLAYLVEKIRLQSGQGSLLSTSIHSKHVNDWEEKRVEQALLNIAMEYRDQEENKRMLSVPGVSSNQDKHDKRSERGSLNSMQTSPCRSTNSSSLKVHVPGSPNSLASSSSNVTDLSGVSRSHTPGSQTDPRRRPSLARLKKFLKL